MHEGDKQQSEVQQDDALGKRFADVMDVSPSPPVRLQPVQHPMNIFVSAEHLLWSKMCFGEYVKLCICFFLSVKQAMNL